MRKTTVILAVALVACSSSSGSESFSSSAAETGPCGAPSGAYVEHLDDVGGDCGKVDDQVIVLGGATSASLASSCVGSQSKSTNGCEITTDETCPFGGGNNAHTTGIVKWRTDGAFATGELTVTLYSPNGSPTCTGTYNITYVKK